MNLDTHAVEAEARDDGLERTFLVDGEPIACYGAIRLWDGVYQVWVDLTPHAAEHGYALTRDVLRALDELERDYGAVRIQASVLEGHAAGERWMKAFGFEIEGLMLRYGPGGKGNYWMFARVKRAEV